MGTVQWDFAKLVMEFSWDGKQVKLEAGQEGRMKVVESDLEDLGKGLGLMLIQ